MATSPLSSRGPTCGLSGYITPTIWRVPNALHGDKNHKWLPHPYRLKGQHLGKWLLHPYHRGVPQRLARGRKLQMATSILPPRGPMCGLSGLHHPYHLGGPNALHGDENHKWLPHPSHLRGPCVGKVVTSLLLPFWEAKRWKIFWLEIFFG